jgi:hypothetical protein
MEACFDRGWTDGLPVVPPTPERVLRMLAGTTRAPGEVLGLVPPDLAPCTVEKVAINAVMAGCKPEYMPLVLAAVEAALIDEFGMHGVLCTTMFCGPLVIVNGPMGRAVGVNSGVNALGQGHRANASIGRALQLVIRNVGGGRPRRGRPVHAGHAGQVQLLLRRERDPRVGAAACAARLCPRGVHRHAVCRRRRAGRGRPEEPHARVAGEELCRLPAGGRPSETGDGGDALLVVSPDHCRVFLEAGWSKARLLDELTRLLTVPGEQLVAGADGIAEGIPAALAGKPIPKFRPGGLLIVRAGGGAGLFSAIIAGWAASGPVGSIPVTKEITA